MYNHKRYSFNNKYMHTWRSQQSRCQSQACLGRSWYLHGHPLQFWAAEDLYKDKKYLSKVCKVIKDPIELYNVSNKESSCNLFMHANHTHT